MRARGLNVLAIVTAALLASDAMSQGWDRERFAAATRLHEVIVRHPMALVSQGLEERLRSHAVSIYLVPPEDALLRRMDQAASIGCWERPGRPPLIALSVSISVLLDPRRSDESLMLILWHETLHLVELETGATDPSVFAPRRLGFPVSRSFVEMAVRGEFRAYESEFQLGQTLGWPDISPLATTYRVRGRAAMACELIEEYSRLPLYKGHEDDLVEIAEAWAQEE